MRVVVVRAADVALVAATVVATVESGVNLGAAMHRHLHNGTGKKKNVKMCNVDQPIAFPLGHKFKTYIGHPALLLSHTRMASDLHKHWRGVPHGRLVVAVVELRLVICVAVVVVGACVASDRVVVEVAVGSEVAMQRHLKGAKANEILSNEKRGHSSDPKEI